VSPLYTQKKGFSLVEIVIVVSIFLVILIPFVGLLNLLGRSAVANTAKVQATFLEEEGLEAVRLLRDSSWGANIGSQISGAYFFLAFDGVNWTATTSNVYVDNMFERKVQVSDVYRNTNQDIVSSGGFLDSNTKKITVSVSWFDRGATTTRSLSTYITNLFNN